LTITSPPSVSVVIPTCGHSVLVDGNVQYLVVELLKSFSSDTSALHEIIVVADAHTPQEVMNALFSQPKVVLENFSEPFNFSKKCNVGAQRASGEIILFLNDDMLAHSAGWVSQIQQQFTDPSVGGVGGLLLTPEGLVQCAGHANAPRPHIYGVGKDPKDLAFRSQLMMTRETSGLSGACFAVRRTDYMEVGGMCEELPSSYNDVDLGFKLKETGKKLMYVPSIQFVHYESMSRNPTVSAEETSLIWRRWGRYFDHDPLALPL
jgi:GT2 family glycosyltransferase